MRNDASARSWVGRHRTAAEIGAGLLAFAAVLGITFFQWGPTVDGAIRGITLGGWVALAVYLVVRRRRVAEEQRASAAVDQRLRIARELHDTVAGAVSSIGIQAAAARRVLRTSPDDAALALERIESASRGANADLRRMLDALREGGPMSGRRRPASTGSRRSRRRRGRAVRTCGCRSIPPRLPWVIPPWTTRPIGSCRKR